MKHLGTKKLYQSFGWCVGWWLMSRWLNLTSDFPRVSHFQNQKWEKSLPVNLPSESLFFLAWFCNKTHKNKKKQEKQETTQETTKESRKEISFGDIPNSSSSIDLAPSLTTLAPFCAVVLPMWTMLLPWSKQSHGWSCQSCKATNHTGTLRNLNLPPEPTPTRAGTLQNPPEPSRTFRNQPFGIFRNLLPP